MRRFLSVSLPYWPIERWCRAEGRKANKPPAHKPFVLCHSTTGGQRVYALSRAAAELDLSCGMPLADARVLVPELMAAPAAPQADIAALRGLARWCQHWSPWTAADPGAPGLDGVLIEITGCAHLFGGEDALLSNMAVRLTELDLMARLASAPSLGLAWALARYDPATTRRPLSIAKDDAPARLASLPIEALRLPGETCEKLRTLGLTRVGAIMRQPRAALARRFGPKLPLRLDQARGIEPEPLAPLHPFRAFRIKKSYPEPLNELEHIKRAARALLDPFCAQLARAGCGVRRLCLTLRRVDEIDFVTEVGTAAPSQDAVHLGRLLDERLDRIRIDLGFGIETLTVTAPKTAPMQAVQCDLERETHGMDPSKLADRLTARLGEVGVRRAVSHESWIPEIAGTWASVEGPSYIPRAHLVRPLLVLSRPEAIEALSEIPDGPPRAFVWRRIRHRVAQAEGPERIAPEWWREVGNKTSRDYFRVETTEGRRLWLYRDGLYGGETSAPRWFVHGAS